MTEIDLTGAFGPVEPQEDVIDLSGAFGVQEETVAIGVVAEPPTPSGTHSRPASMPILNDQADIRRRLIIKLGVTLAYLLAVELPLLHWLATTMIDAGATQHQADLLSTALKLSGAFGICWTWGRELFFGLRMPWWLKVPAFAGYVVGVFGALYLGLNAIAHNLPDTVKVNAMTVVHARSAWLKGEVDGPVKTSLNSMGYGLATFDREAMGLEAIMEPLRLSLEAEIEKVIDDGWERYQEAQNSIQAAFDGYRDAIDRVRYDPPSAHGPIRKKLEEATGGLPMTIRTREQFVEIGLASSTAPKAVKARELREKVLIKLPDGTAIRGRDIPLWMDRAAFDTWASGYKAKAMSAIRPSAEGLATSPELYNSAAGAAVMPPISAVISAVAILLNLGTMVALLIQLAAKGRGRLAEKVLPAAFLAIGILLSSTSHFDGSMLAKMAEQDWLAWVAMHGLALAGLFI